MASGTIKGSFSNIAASRLYPEIAWSDTANNAANNSTVTAILRFTRVDSNMKTYNMVGMSTSISINGNNSSARRTFDLRNSATVEVWRRTLTVAHNNDGTKSINISSSGNTNGSAAGTWSVSGTVNLTAIPRAYSFVISSATAAIGDPYTIKINGNGTNFTAKAHLVFGSAIIRFNDGNNVPVGTNQNITLDPAILGPAIPNATSGKGTVYVDTYNGSTKIGTVGQGVTLSYPAKYVPAAPTLAITDTSAVPTVLGATGRYVQSISNLGTKTTAAGIHGSTVRSIIHSIGGKQVASGADTSFSLAGIASGEQTLLTTLTDSRGRVSTKETILDIIPYEGPKISEVSVVRTGAPATTLQLKKTIKVFPTPETGINKNTYTVKTDIRYTGTESWVNLKTETNTSSASLDLTGVGEDKSGTLRITVQDKLSSAVIFNTSIATATKILDFYKDVGIGVGKMYEEGHGVLDVGGDIWMNGRSLLDTFYPIGSIYQSVKSTDPSTFMGGTWERFGNGKVLVGVDESDTDFASAEKTGGKKRVGLRALIGAYNSTGNTLSYKAGGPVTGDTRNFAFNRLNTDASTITTINHTTLVKQENGQDASVLQPYITVYMWKRTA